MNTLSIAMATYNGASHLHDQLNSFVSQTRQPDELVVRDDGSTDGTAAILEEFATRAPFPVRVLPANGNLGYVKNFETVIQACTGDLIALSDQDDVWLPHKLAMLEAALGNDDRALLTFSDAALVGADLEPLGRTLWESVGLDTEVCRGIEAGGTDSALMRGFYVTGATVCFRRSLLPLALPMELPHWHDAWLALAATAYGRVVAVDEPLVLYRQHGGNTLGAPAAPRGHLPVWERAVGYARAGHLLRVSEDDERTFDKRLRRRRMLMNAVSQRFTDSSIPGLASFLRDHEAHTARRLRLARQPLPLKLGSVLASWLSGHYKTFDRGLWTVLLDLRR